MLASGLVCFGAPPQPSLLKVHIAPAQLTDGITSVPRLMCQQQEQRDLGSDAVSSRLQLCIVELTEPWAPRICFHRHREADERIALDQCATPFTHFLAPMNHRQKQSEV